MKRFSLTDRWMLAAIAAALLAGFGLACQKYRHFGGDTNDVTVYSYAFAQTLHGKFLPLYYQDGNLLGNHPNWIVLAWLPVYAVWRSFYSLLFFQSLLLVAAAWPVYRLAQHVLRNDRAALAFGALTLLFPTIASQHVNQLHDDQFALPFVLWAFYFFVREDYRKFLVSVVLACLAKETVGLTTAMFGVWALLQRRHWKWPVAGIGLSVALVLLGVFLVTKVFTGAGAVLYTGTRYFEAYGKTPGEVLTTFLARPGFVAEAMFGPAKREYLWHLLLPALVAVPFLTWAVVVSLPNLLLNLLGSNTALIVIPWHYNLLLGGTLIAASVFGAHRLAGWCGAHRERVMVGLPVLMLLGALWGARYWYSGHEYQPRPHQASLDAALAQVPRDATVLAPTPMLAHLSDRSKVNSAYSIFVVHNTPEQLFDYEYLILDGNWRAYEAIGQRPLVAALQTNQAYRLILNEDNVFVLRRARQQ